MNEARSSENHRVPIIFFFLYELPYHIFPYKLLNEFVRLQIEIQETFLINAGRVDGKKIAGLGAPGKEEKRVSKDEDEDSGKAGREVVFLTTRCYLTYGISNKSMFEPANLGS